MSELETAKKVSKEDLQVIKEVRNVQEFANKQLENATLQKKLADSSYENTLLRLYLKYELKSTDSFNQETGEINRGEDSDESTESEDATGTE